MKKLYLEFVRGTASVGVLLYHLPESWFTPTEFRRFSMATLGTDAVIMFFILSGCVINISYSRNPGSRWDFMRKRLLRLVPQFLLAVLFGLFAMWCRGKPLPSSGQLLGNVFMLSTLQGFIVQSLSGNAVVWSLTYEMFFYLVFMLTIGRLRRQAVLCWLIIALSMIPLCYHLSGIGVVDHFIAMFAFSAIWLVGYYVYEYRNQFYVDGYTAAVSLGTLPILSRLTFAAQWPGVDPLKHFLFALVAIPFFRYCLQAAPSGKKLPVFFPVVVYAGLAMLFLQEPGYSLLTKVMCILTPPGLALLFALMHRLGFKDRAIAVINRLGAVLGKYSYSLYIVHVPVLILCSYYFHYSVALYVLAGLSCIALLTYLMESHFQPAVVRFFRRNGRNRRSADTTTVSAPLQPGDN